MLVVPGALPANGLPTVPALVAARVGGSSSMMAEARHEGLMKKAEPRVDMIFLETARAGEPGPDESIPAHVG